MSDEEAEKELSKSGCLSVRRGLVGQRFYIPSHRKTINFELLAVEVPEDSCKIGMSPNMVMIPGLCLCSRIMKQDCDKGPA